MSKKYGIFLVIIIIFLAGFLVTLLNYFYSFDYLYNYLIRRDFAVNPRAEVLIDKEYTVRIWYYPFYRGLNSKQEKAFFELLQEEVAEVYPNIKIIVGKINFNTGHDKLKQAIKDGNPADIYFNLTDYDLIEEDLQIPVSPYLSNIEKEAFYTIDWNKISHRDKLWGWPVLVDGQSWLISNQMNINIYGKKFLEQVSNLKKNTLYLNYQDTLLLKQLLSLLGLDTFKIEKDGKLDIDSYRALEDLFYFLEYLREEEILAKKISQMPDIFLKAFIEGDAQLIGPVNSYLKEFVSGKMAGNIKELQVDKLKKNYYLNIFRQRKYQGDDHSRAVMEVARIFSQNLAKDLAEELALKSAYMPEYDSQVMIEAQSLIEIGPEIRDYWQGFLIPLWIEFWEEELSAREVMRRLEKNNEIKDVTVAFMEVPCCTGIVRTAETAIAKSGKDIKLKKIKISIRGEKEEIK